MNNGTFFNNPQNNNLQGVPAQNNIPLGSTPPVGVQPVQQPVMQQPVQQPMMQPVQQPVMQQAQPVQQVPPVIQTPNTQPQQVQPMPQQPVMQQPIGEQQPAPEPPKLDPLNNANNPIPVNPVAPIETKEKIKMSKVTPFDIIKTTFGIIKNPGKQLEETVTKYEHTISAFTYTLFLTITSVIMMLIMRIVMGGFVKNYDIATGSYTTSFDFSQVTHQNFLMYILIALAVSGIAILGVSIIYYATSFFKSKGMTLGKNIMICNVSFIPMILGFIVGYPLGGIVSGYIALLVLVICILYTIILFITGMNKYIQEENISKKIHYNILNFSIICVVILLVIFLLFRDAPIAAAINIGL